MSRDIPAGAAMAGAKAPSLSAHARLSSAAADIVGSTGAGATDPRAVAVGGRDANACMVSYMGRHVDIPVTSPRPVQASPTLRAAVEVARARRMVWRSCWG